MGQIRLQVHLEAGVGSGRKGFGWEDLVYLFHCLFHLKIQREAAIMKVGGGKCW